MTETLTQTDIESVKQAFAQWRASRGKRIEPIPQHLWQAAVELCNTHRITHVCRHLRLSFADLKKRLPPKENLSFVELHAGGLFGQWQLTCERPDGTRLRLSAAGQMPPLDALIRQFLA